MKLLSQAIKLGQILVQEGHLSEEQLESALKRQKVTKKKLGEYLVEEQIVNESVMLDCLSKRLGLPAVRLRPGLVDPLIVDTIDKEVAEKHVIIPLFKVEDTLTVAMAEPQALLVVDDLEPGFTVMEEVQTGGLRLATRQRSSETMDQGLPVRNGGRLPGRWSRSVNGATWGKYRHTMAMIRAGNGEKKAVFKTEIPQAGSWDLELHMPQNIFNARLLGTWNLAVVDGNGDRHEMEFDSKSAPGGWNLVERLDLPEGETQLILSDKTDGRVVVADAIRWSPAAGE